MNDCPRKRTRGLIQGIYKFKISVIQIIKSKLKIKVNLMRRFRALELTLKR